MYKAIAHFIAQRGGVLSGLMRPRTSRPQRDNPRAWTAFGDDADADPFEGMRAPPPRATRHRGSSDDDLLADLHDWRAHP